VTVSVKLHLFAKGYDYYKENGLPKFKILVF